MKFTLLLVSIIYLINSNNCFKHISDVFGIIHNISEDSRKNFTQLVKKFNIEVEDHDVVTEDGYILKLFHLIPNKPSLYTLPVLIMHGVLDSADNFIIRGNTSLSVTLVREGFDVWVANGRGNRYGRRHLSLDPDRDPAFWNYSAHEHGVYDLPAFIDYVLKKTGKNKLNAIAHSQGTTDFFILCSEKPEYNDKVNLMIALAPVAYLHDMGPIVDNLVESAPLINQILLSTGQEEVFTGVMEGIFELICSQGEISYNICVRGLLFPFGGEDAEELEPEFIPVFLGHYPQPVSRKSLLHLSQIASQKRFTKFDYGDNGNRKIYNTSVAPNYDLSKVTMKVALFYGVNDGLATVKNVARLKKKLPNVVEYYKVKQAKWNHLDWVWAKNLDKYLYPYLLTVLKRYSQ